MNQSRFADQNKRISDFQAEVLVVCPQCEKQANAQADYKEKKARVLCANCGYNKTCSTETTVLGARGNWRLAAHEYFDVMLWLTHPFKNDVIWAYNYEHLNYLEQYIAATLREHKDRTHFTLLEKLPRFYHEAKNRADLLKIINKLKNK